MIGITTRGVLLIYIVFTCVLLITGCTSYANSDNEIQEFLDLPLDERRTTISNYPHDVQINLYLAAMYKHPPDLGLADEVAKCGKDLIPFIKERIVYESDFAKLQLIDVFERMQRLGYYSVAKDELTMQLLDDQVASMNDEQWKLMATQVLEDIRQK